MKKGRTSAVRRVPCVIAAAIFIFTGCSESTDESGRPLDGSLAVDRAALEQAVDERWGEAPDVETRLEHFDSLWAHIGSTYAGFVTLPSLDWDAVRDTYRPQFESADSYGRLFTLTAELMHLGERGTLKNSPDPTAQTWVS
jgi:hypothetical protein